ncbi:MAG: hypothetical protein LBH14_02230 [Desulfobulbaceae bacterium]|jgi:hypothetical protein|nr:hypothetical protein [Desulfobulbaceae bacterium]
MEENNNINKSGGQPEKGNPFKNWLFYVSYLITLVVLTAITLLFTAGTDLSYWVIPAFMVSIPSIIVGIVIGFVMWNKNRSVALGILLGSITPFIIIFVGTGGCGLFNKGIHLG